VTDDYLNPQLERIQEERRELGGRWLLIKPAGAVPWIGPVLGEALGPCWDCLCHWLRTNQPVREAVRRQGKAVLPASAVPASAPVSQSIACNLAALAIANWFAAVPGMHPLQRQLLELDLASLQNHWHTVVRRPQCARCGDPSLMDQIGRAPVQLRSVARPHTEDGGFRSQAPRETYQKYAHLISSVTGAVTHVAPMPERDTPGRAVYTSGHRVTPRGLPRREHEFRRPCAGKGKTSEQARTSALCEALERYSGVYQGDEARERGSFLQLAPRAIHPDLLQHFSAAQRLAAKDQILESVAPHRWVAKPFDERLPLDWTPAWSLTNERQRLVPLAYCYSETPQAAELEFCQCNPNGAAAGNCLEEAILQGFLELVERDAVAIWWYNRLRRPGFDLDAFGDAYFRGLKRDYARLGWKVWALDLTHDLAIPTSVALAHEPETNRFCIGFGCHFSPLLAVQRALTEMNQLFSPSEQSGLSWDLGRLPAQDFLFPSPELPATRIDAAHEPEAGDLKADVLGCVERLAGAGLELLVVNKTRPDVGLPVVQVIVPGLRHFWPRLADGRLYRVPAQLGWLKSPLAEAELNPVPMFL
jgi:bacteriocin biosynthesis cyclodehydratase domain-containing protein